MKVRHPGNKICQRAVTQETWYDFENGQTFQIASTFFFSVTNVSKIIFSCLIKCYMKSLQTCCIIGESYNLHWVTLANGSPVPYSPAVTYYLMQSFTLRYPWTLRWQWLPLPWLRPALCDQSRTSERWKPERCVRLCAGWDSAMAEAHPRCWFRVTGASSEWRAAWNVSNASQHTLLHRVSILKQYWCMW